MKPEVQVRRPVGAAASPVRTLAAAVIVFAVFGLVCSLTTLWSMRGHGHSTATIIIHDFVVWSCGWSALTPLVAWLGRRVPVIPVTTNAIAFHVVVALVASFAHHVWWLSMTLLFRPFDGMGTQTFSDAITNHVFDRMFLEVTIYFAVLGVTYAVDNQRRLRERELRAAQLETSLAQAKLTALELQLQPHFLFNTLHMIGGLVRQDRRAEAVEMIIGLGDLLRYSLDHAGGHEVSLEQELAIAERYLEIQRQRFSDRMKVVIDVTPEARRMQMPAMMLQPLLENAVRHGIERSTGQSLIAVSARAEDGRLELEVFNTGELGEIEAGIGISNTRARLHQLYGARHSFELRGEPEGVVASIVLRSKAAA